VSLPLIFLDKDCSGFVPVLLRCQLRFEMDKDELIKGTGLLLPCVLALITGSDLYSNGTVEAEGM
jgi:hypothetical protein